MQSHSRFSTGLLLGALGLLPALVPADVAAAEAPREEIEFFEAKIRPVLVGQCYECHASESKKAKGGLLLDSREGLLRGGESGPALVPGKPSESILLSALKHENLEMPPKKKLSAEVVRDFERWIDRGATDPRLDATPAPVAGKGVDIEKARQHWAFVPPVRGPRPAVQRKEWPAGEVDYHVLAALEAKQLRPVAPAGKRELLRRATFDLTGLPPTPGEVEAFLADESPQAFARVVDRLLASPHYGERWGRYWLDVARYAEDQAHTFAVTPNTSGYRYRDWVIEAFNSDMPYNEFVKRQIAGDKLGDSPEQARQHIAALGFFGLGAQYYKNSDKAKALADELDDRVDTLTRGFLGLTVACARCHDHKFDPVPTQDYYSLAGVFQSSNLKNIPLVSKDEVDVYEAGQARIKAEEAKIKTFLAGQKKEITENQVDRVPEYLEAVWKIRTAKPGSPAPSAKELADRSKLRETALKKWTELLDEKNRGKIPALAAWYDLLAAVEPAGANGEAPPARLAEVARSLQSRIQAALAERDGRAPSEATTPKGDAKFVSPVLNPGKRFMDLEVDISGATHLYLVVTNGGDDINSDHADWCEPRLLGPAGERKLTDLQWKSSRSSYGTVRLHTNFSGAPLLLGGRRFEYGIGTHAASEVVYELPEGFQKFKATVGLDGQASGSVQFRVYVAPPSDLPALGLPAAKPSPQSQELLAAVLGDKGVLAVADDEVERLLGEEPKTALAALKAGVEAERKKAPALYPLVHGIADATPADMKVFVRGDPARQGELAPRRFLRILSGADEPARFSEGSGRRELAEAVASADNPLTARVMVNRIWRHHFGTGLVGTPSNFGLLGDAPTHPALLDYLAVRFVESGWSLKAVHRELMLSSTYQLGTARDAHNDQTDADNRWLWRMNRRRLDVESWRDALLSVSGLLDRKLGGPSTDLGQANNRRRTVYGKVSRHELDGLLRLFDFPDANITSDKRSETTVPQQQLFVLNSPFMIEQAKAFSARLQAERTLADDRARVNAAFLLAYGRPAAAPEVEVITSFLAGTDPVEQKDANKLTRWERVAQAVLGANEFLYTD